MSYGTPHDIFSKTPDNTNELSIGADHSIDELSAILAELDAVVAEVDAADALAGATSPAPSSWEPPDFSTTAEVERDTRADAHRIIAARKAQKAARATLKARDRKRKERADKAEEAQKIPERVHEAGAALEAALAGEGKGRTLVQLRGRWRRGEPVVARLTIALAVTLHQRHKTGKLPSRAVFAEAFNRVARDRVPAITPDGGRCIVDTMRLLAMPGECWDGIAVI